MPLKYTWSKLQNSSKSTLLDIINYIQNTSEIFVCFFSWTPGTSACRAVCACKFSISKYVLPLSVYVCVCVCKSSMLPCLLHLCNRMQHSNLESHTAMKMKTSLFMCVCTRACESVCLPYAGVGWAWVNPWWQQVLKHITERRGCFVLFLSIFPSVFSSQSRLSGVLELRQWLQFVKICTFCWIFPQIYCDCYFPSGAVVPCISGLSLKQLCYIVFCFLQNILIESKMMPRAKYPVTMHENTEKQTYRGWSSWCEQLKCAVLTPKQLNLFTD